MWIKSSGILSENVAHLTTAASTHLLAIGDVGALVDASVSAMHERLIEQIVNYIGDDGDISFVLLTHAHFDHVGGLPYLRQQWPELEVIAAPQTAELLEQAETKELLYEKNLSCMQALNAEMGMSKEDWISAIRVDRIIGDGDIIDLGDDVEVKLISSPGHTHDSVAYFVMPDFALACGETVGSYGGREKVTSCFTHEYQAYVESLGKLSSLDVKALCFPHSGVITGELVPKFLVDARQAADRFRDAVRERIEQGELVQEIYESILPEWQSQNISPEGPFVEEQGDTLLQMIKASAVSDPETEESDVETEILDS